MTRIVKSIVLQAVLLGGSIAGAAPPPLPPGYPEPVRRITAGARFAEPEYFELMASDGLRRADGKALFDLLSRASARGETYKALFLATLFTEANPSLAAGWENRARLAAAVGLEAEAEACAANAANPDAPAPVPPSLLTGSLEVRPSTLADWAASLALTADALAAVAGPNAIGAVRDDISGQILYDADNDAVSMGDTPRVEPDGIALAHVGPNLFHLAAAEPMNARGMKTGAFIGGLLLASFAAYAGGTPGLDASAVNSAVQLSGQSAQLMASAYEVPSRFSKGSYRTRFYAAGTMSEAPVNPKSSGEDSAVGVPVPVLWTSGSALSPHLTAVWKSNDGQAPAFELTGGVVKEKGPKQGATLRFPRLARLCLFSECSTAVTLQELLLTRDDVELLAPALVSSLPALDLYERDYASPILDLVLDAGFTDLSDLGDRLREMGSKVGVSGRGYSMYRPAFVAYDERGKTYVLGHGPAAWLTPPTTTKTR